MHLACFDSTKILFIFIIDLLVCSSKGAREPSFRAIGGRDASPNEFPYIVYIEQRQSPAPPSTAPTVHSHVCTASALSATVTLTAEHCCFSFNDTIHVKDPSNATTTTLELSMVIRYGSDTGRLTNDDRYSDVLSCLRPRSARPAFDTMMTNDIALVTTQPMPLSAYGRLSAVDQRTLYGQRVLVLGFGLTNNSDGEVTRSRVQKKPLQVVDVMWSQCEDQERQLLYPLVCGMEKCGQHAALCEGDSGGPSLYDSKIVGVSSKSPLAANCQMKTDTSRYSMLVQIMPLSGYMDWIATAIAEMPKF